MLHPHGGMNLASTLVVKESDGSSSRVKRRNLSTLLGLRHVELIPRLQVHPELRRGVKGVPQQHRRLASNPAIAVDYSSDAVWWNAKGQRKAVRTQAIGGKKLLLEDLAWVNEHIRVHRLISLIISVAARPSRAPSPAPIVAGELRAAGWVGISRDIAGIRTPMAGFRPVA